MTEWMAELGDEINTFDKNACQMGFFGLPFGGIFKGMNKWPIMR
jgi:hypothetical protein